MEFAEAARINRALNKAAKLYRAAKARKLAALGLHPGQDVLLWVLAEAGDGMTVSELAARLGIEPPTATRSLARMDKSELFRRVPVPTDRRQVRVVMTEHGRDLIPAIERAWAELAEETLGHLPKETRTLVIAALEEANDHLRHIVGDAAEAILADG
ncbi:MarR family transcriptional regulator [Spongiactinospora gelatinilytica]|uniref:MarR family transcriptional regulator n=1 Tax=Spongiactinospora gelatinilytica TaxID=2666298 RepID=A0A2W2GPF8_9ACTN|nr:MarR family transcriptional regulator [Spongiactinospora gelatinilytica]PZG50401.1 MarR family transcriptional regulator [Spongiactinospora gelatinilytica]